MGADPAVIDDTTTTTTDRCSMARKPRKDFPEDLADLLSSPESWRYGSGDRCNVGECPKYQCMPATATAPSSPSCCRRRNRRLDMCDSCGGPSTSAASVGPPPPAKPRQTNCKTSAMCDLLNSCRQISIGDSVNRAKRTPRVGSRHKGGGSFLGGGAARSKFFNSVISQHVLVHALASMLLFQLFAAPALVYGLSSSGNHTSSHSTGSSAGGSTSSFEGFESSLTAYKVRENAIRREPNLSYTSGGCHSCRMREQVKAENLASIKRHILLRLELKTPPNITSPVVPREIIEKFYKNHNMFNRSVSSNGGSPSITTTAPITNMNRDGGYRDGSSSSSSSSYDSMQGDDPRTYIDYAQNSEENESEDYEEEFFSVVNSLYVFPTMPRMRHNRKPDILHFSFTNNGHSSVSQANLHVYLRGRDWIRDFESTLLTGGDGENLPETRQEIILTINRVLRRQNSPNSTHTQKVTEIRQHVPNGAGTWITVDVTEMVSNWFSSPNTNHGLVIKTLEPWMKPLVVTDDNPSNKAYALYIEIQTKDNRKRRTKRNTSLNCSESDNEERCCRYPLEVDFRKFDWDWIVAPTSFNAYFCNGECKLGFLPKYPHTHLMQLSTAPQPCCSPTKMSPIKLLYFNNDRNLVMSTIPNMAVDKCSCS